MFSACQSNSTPKGINNMKGEVLQKIEDNSKDKEKYLVIDVRNHDEYAKGHIKFAINIPLDELEGKISYLTPLKDKLAFVVYCNTGHKSAKAAEILEKNKFPKVYNADGVKKYNYALYTYENVLGDVLDKFSKDENALIIDTRPADAFKNGHLKNAINIPPEAQLKDYEKQLESYKNKPIITYCFTGNKSQTLAKQLTDAGFTNVYNSLDGTKEYKFELVK